MSEHTCFIISPIGDEGSEVREQADKVLKFIIEPVLREKGYNAVRADSIDKTGIITNQIIEMVLESELVIADLSGRNPNVFYELALRHAARLPLVQIIKKGEDIPFDVSTMRTISYTLNLEGAEKAKRDISSFIDSIDGNKIESPVSVAIDLFKTDKSGKPIEAELAKLNSNIGRLSSQVESLEGDFQFHDNDDIANKIDDLSSEISDLGNDALIAETRLTKYIKLKSQGKLSKGYPVEYILSDIALVSKYRMPWISELAKELSINGQKEGEFETLKLTELITLSLSRWHSTGRTSGTVLTRLEIFRDALEHSSTDSE